MCGRTVHGKRSPLAGGRTLKSVWTRHFAKCPVYWLVHLHTCFVRAETLVPQTGGVGDSTHSLRAPRPDMEWPVPFFILSLWQGCQNLTVCSDIWYDTVNCVTVWALFIFFKLWAACDPWLTLISHFYIYCLFILNCICLGGVWDQIPELHPARLSPNPRSCRLLFLVSCLRICCIFWKAIVCLVMYILPNYQMSP